MLASWVMGVHCIISGCTLQWWMLVHRHHLVNDDPYPDPDLQYDSDPQYDPDRQYDRNPQYDPKATLSAAHHQNTLPPFLVPPEMRFSACVNQYASPKSAAPQLAAVACHPLCILLSISRLSPWVPKALERRDRKRNCSTLNGSMRDILGTVCWAQRIALLR